MREIQCLICEGKGTFEIFTGEQIDCECCNGTGIASKEDVEKYNKDLEFDKKVMEGE